MNTRKQPLAVALFLSTVALLSLNFQANGQLNLLTNGDFSLGNAGFASAYVYAPGNIYSAGTYDVVYDPHQSHPLAASIQDHTTGSGLMLAANGSTDTNAFFWKETVTVSSNATYVLSGWGATWAHNPGEDFDGDPPSLVFSVNGIQLGSAVRLPRTNGVWQSFTALWQSDSTTQAVIEVRSSSSAVGGNDFSLDDLAFFQLQTNQFAAATIYRSVEIAWPSTPNSTYQVQWAPALSTGSWFNFGSPVTATSTNTSAWDRVLWDNRFYRVLNLQ